MRFVVEKTLSDRVVLLKIIAEDAKAIRAHHENVRIFKLNDSTTFDQAIRSLTKKKGN